MPDRICVPAPLSTSDSGPVPPSCRMPENVVAPEGGAMVSVAAVATPFWTVPLPDSDLTAFENPFSPRTPFTVKSEFGDNALALDTATTLDAVTVVAPP